MFTVLLTILGIAVLCAFLIWAITYWKLRHAIIEVGKVSEALDSELSELERKGLRSKEELLSKFGFDFSHYAMETPSVVVDSARYPLAVYRQKNGKVFARVRPNTGGDGSATILVQLRSYHESGSVAVTDSEPAELHLREPDTLVVSPDSGLPIEERIKSHIAFVNADSGYLVVSGKDSIVRDNRLLYEEVESLVNRGLLSESPRGDVRMKPSVCAKDAFTVLARFPKLLKHQRQVAEEERVDQMLATTSTPSPKTANPIERDLLAYEMAEDEKRRKKPHGPLVKLGLLILSMVAFFIWFGYSFTPVSAVIIVVVLLLHELGHYFAMMVFGYKDVSMLFIPFFGAAVSGEEQAQTEPWKKLIVCFAGPLPGIMLGFALMFAAAMWEFEYKWVDEAISMLIWINVFNLLPFMPLDGGRVISIALLTRFPLLQCGIYAVSSLGMLALSLFTGGGVLRWIGISIALVLPHVWRKGIIVRRIRERLGKSFDRSDRDFLLYGIFTEMQIPSLQKQSVASRNSLAKEALKELQSPLPSWGTLILAVALMTSPMWAPAVALVPLKPIAAMKADAAFKELEEADLPSHREHSSPMPLAESDNAASYYKKAIDIWNESNFSGQEVVSYLWKAHSSSDTNEIRETIQALKPYADNSSYKKALALISEGMSKKRYEPIEKETELVENELKDEYMFVDLFDVSFESYQLGNVASAISFNALNLATQGKSDQAFREAEKIFKIADQLRRSIGHENPDTVTRFVSEGVNTYRTLSYLGLPKRGTNYKRAFGILSKADKTLSDTAKSHMAYIKYQREQEVFNREKPLSKEEMGAFKNELGLWLVPDFFISYYFNSALIEFDRAAFAKYYEKLARGAPQLPYERGWEEQKLSFVDELFSWDRLVTSSTRLSTEMSVQSIDAQRVNLRLSSMAYMIYMERNAREALPKSLNRYVRVASMSDWIKDPATGELLHYEVAGDTFTLRSEHSEYEDWYQYEEFDEYYDEAYLENDDEGYDDRMYWKGNYANYPEDPYDDYYAGW